MDTPKNLNPIARAKAVFQKHGGLLRMTTAVNSGIHRNTLKRMLAEGDVQKIDRGLYQLVDAVPPTDFDLAAVGAKAPAGVICLISALSFHEITTQIPHVIWLAIRRNSEPPRIHYPPVRVFRFGDKTFSEGVEIHDVGPVKVRIYSREKTLADCFQYRNQVGLDTCLEAVKMYKEQRRYNVDAIMKYAKINRVAKIMRPYLEAIL